MQHYSMYQDYVLHVSKIVMVVIMVLNRHIPINHLMFDLGKINQMNNHDQSKGQLLTCVYVVYVHHVIPSDDVVGKIECDGMSASDMYDDGMRCIVF